MPSIIAGPGIPSRAQVNLYRGQIPPSPAAAPGGTPETSGGAINRRKRRPGILAEAGRQTGRLLARHPIRGSIALAGSLAFGHELFGQPLARAAATSQDELLRHGIQDEFANRRYARSAQASIMGLQRTMAENEARLAAVDPALYQQLSAGRRLARDTVRIGGTPRRDIIEEVALRMSIQPREGGFTTTEEEEAMLARELGIQ